MGRLTIRPTPLDGLAVVESLPISDQRGQFARIFCDEECGVLRPHLHWRQINISRTHSKGTVRGMHFQYPPAAEAKLIRCLRGKVFDVAVDLRAGSPTRLHWYSVELSEDNSLGIFIPEGFAHGFQALSDDVELLYMHTCTWHGNLEGGLRYDDPTLAITWPIPVTQVSEKDRNATLLNDSFAGIHL